ncbi:TMEM165/GDT1 family protein [Nocardia farcinica]|uniref:GDT1 family protein n=5 Tax=Nocardia TaxID=1817 RepID=Q5Z3N3_NOCFA|nr:MULTISPECIES: TMEM165/GDT1 family protein [Nocardia]MBC9815609.1 TMEM165/GDT1 family protein [Nocardia farcinica]MBF6069972.1 TMEM165/GDT1 family protein [Nocardia farcinica]MBF6188514.1 TMEM165/GDT1 family protein [Nocardia farcinica]MBF6233301.1 TMEM165/GDT1 family protein [Nocardia farcinica]MBF6251135.1 TMEM165/GDT1 family protein [Nocardia farcinica]
MITTIALSIGIVFLAELGDKSQLMALTFALRYRWWVVLGGIATASAGVHILSVAVGHFLGAALPTRAIALVAALTFLAVGLWTLREHLVGGEEDAPPAPRSSRAPFLVVLSAFLLAELGDRTMFATAALATDNHWFGVWIGSTVGMVAADGLAIALGILLGKHLPEHIIGIASGLLFLLFGGATLLSALAPALSAVAGLALAALLPAAAGAAMLIRKRRRAAAGAGREPDPLAVPRPE